MGSNLKKIADNWTYIYEEATSSSNNFIDFNRSYIVIKDSRNNTDNPDIKVYNSFAITEYSDKKAIVSALLEYDRENPSYPKQWGRSEKSLISEWDAHNCAYSLFPPPQSHTENVDFDYNDENNFIFNLLF